MAWIKEYKTALLSTILDRLQDYGFHDKIHGQSLWRYIDDGKASVHFRTGDYGNVFHVTPDVGIRFEVVERIKNHFRPELPKNVKNQTSTIGALYETLCPNQTSVWTVNKNTNIEQLATELHKVIVDSLIPYLDEYSVMEKVFQCIMDGVSLRLLGNSQNVAISAVALAMSLGKTDMLDEVISVQEQRLRGRGTSANISQFLAFVESIRTIPNIDEFIIKCKQRRSTIRG